MEDRPRGTIMLLDPDNAFRYVEVRGEVTRISGEGGDAHIDTLARKCLGVDAYPYHTPEETRIICYIEPRKVLANG